jgi:DNA excision repair protein ERCC-2
VSETAQSDWQEYFGFSEPYSNQGDVIERIIETTSENGYLAMEGPCGTGKTMAALTAASYLLCETSEFSNIVVATPVKQQRQQFVEDLRQINSGLSEPLSGISLTGKRDLCPYGREGAFPKGESVQSRCEDLRDTTADLVHEDSDLEATSTTKPSGNTDSIPDEEQWWDPEKARTLVDHAQRKQGADTLESAGGTSPYPQAQPATTPEMGATEDQQLYCPFEADWYARDKGSPVTFTAGENHVITPDEFLPESVEVGLCPHRAMMVLLEHADIVIGNYNHLFDEASRQLTAPILDEETLVIIDEAHRLEGRVRDLLTDKIGYYSIKQARRDLGTLLEQARQLSGQERVIDQFLAEHEVTQEAVDNTRTFYTEVLNWIEGRVDSELRDQVESYGSGFSWEALPETDSEIQLRDPETTEQDEFTVWAAENGYGDSFFQDLSKVGLAVEDTLEQIGRDRDCVCTAIGALFGQWWERDHTEYFREIELEHSPKDLENVNEPWLRHYNASLVMYNCMPSTKVKRIFDELGGGVLMSATLEPLSIFKEVSGLEELADGESDDPDQRIPRAVDTRTYDLTFPEENRASWIVDVAPFTKNNRGAPEFSNQNKTRERYAYVARLIAESHGNVMLCWPNYAEAAWAAGRLENEIDKPVLLDESSSNEITQDLKKRFVRGEPKALMTSTRGTLTEGVDYEGDDLHACAVFGIPLVNIGSPRVQAVKHAYGDRFGTSNAFTYALTIPAVRQVRQALGRVIRGPEERGVRIVVGRRFVPDAIHSVHEYFPDTEQNEFIRMKPDFLQSQFDAFWENDF